MRDFITNAELRIEAERLCDENEQLRSEKAALERRIDELCAKVEQGKAENAKLVDVLHEVEQEAIYAYNCLQQDCEAMVDGQTHFFNKWLHAECECDRAKLQNEKLREQCAEMWEAIKTHERVNFATILRFGERLRKLGVIE